MKNLLLLFSVLFIVSCSKENTEETISATETISTEISNIDDSFIDNDDFVEEEVVTDDSNIDEKKCTNWKNSNVAIWFQVKSEWKGSGNNRRICKIYWKYKYRYRSCNRRTQKAKRGSRIGSAHKTKCEKVGA